jgi:ABC-type multidrug transport system ATPase subunit
MADCRYNSSVIGGENCSVKLSERQQQTWFRKSVIELSGGQKQLLNLASVMAMQPKVLILDEPTSELDPIASTDFISILRKINLELGTTIIISEHRLEEVFPIADKVLVMEEGEAQKYGTPLEVGEFLSSYGKSHPMYEGLPTAMKVFSEVNPEGKCPITVRDGKIWLSSLLGDNPQVQRINETNKTPKKNQLFK